MVPVKLVLWDLHGFHDTWNGVRPLMFRRKSAIIFVLDLETRCLMRKSISLCILAS